MSISIEDILLDKNYVESMQFAHTKIPKIPSNYKLLLDIYGLDQTIRVGKNTTKRPPDIDLRGTLKWNVWKKWENTNCREAKRILVSKITEYKKK